MGRETTEPNKEINCEDHEAASIFEDCLKRATTHERNDGVIEKLDRKGEKQDL